MTTPAAQASPRTAERSPLVLCALVIGYAICNTILSRFLPGDADGMLDTVVVTLLVFQVMTFGIWTALGPGSILARLAIAVPTLYLLIVVQHYVAPARAVFFFT